MEGSSEVACEVSVVGEEEENKRRRRRRGKRRGGGGERVELSGGGVVPSREGGRPGQGGLRPGVTLPRDRLIRLGKSG